MFRRGYRKEEKRIKFKREHLIDNIYLSPLVYNIVVLNDFVEIYRRVLHAKNCKDRADHRAGNRVTGLCRTVHSEKSAQPVLRVPPTHLSIWLVILVINRCPEYATLASVGNWYATYATLVIMPCYKIEKLIPIVLFLGCGLVK